MRAVTGRAIGNLKVATVEGLNPAGMMASQMEPLSHLSLPCICYSPFPRSTPKLERMTYKWLVGMAGYSGEGLMILHAPSLYEGRETVNRPRCDGLLREGPEGLLKTVVVWLRRWSCIRGLSWSKIAAHKISSMEENSIKALLTERGVSYSPIP